VRIGLITGEYPPDQGGVGDFTRELGKALVALGHRVHVITSCAQVGKSANRQVGKSASQQIGKSAQGVVVHRDVQGWGWGCWGRILALARELRLEVLDLQYQAAAYRGAGSRRMHPAINFVPHSSQRKARATSPPLAEARATSPPLAGGTEGGEAKRLRRPDRPPVVVTFHDLNVPYLFPKAGPLRWWVVRWCARRADGVIVTNREDELRLQTLLSNLARIPIGSNIAPRLPEGYDRDAWRARWGLGPHVLLLGYFGFLNERKGGEELVETLAVLVRRGLPAHLLLIGGRAGTSDPSNVAYAERVDHLIEEQGLAERVHRTGFVSSEEVSASLAAVDVCLLPYRDGVCLRHGSLHACLVHGRAVVTTHPAVSVPEVQDGENALLVEPQNPEEMADAVARLVADPALRTQLESGAAALGAEFGWDRIARRTVAFFRALGQLPSSTFR